MNVKKDIPVLLGGLAGGVLGHFLFFWIVRQGFYGLILPGALVGLGAGIFKVRSRPVAIVCGVLALAMGVFTEWRFGPFRVNGSLGYFLLHFHELRPVSFLMIGAGGFVGFWVPFRRIGKKGPAIER